MRLLTLTIPFLLLNIDTSGKQLLPVIFDLLTKKGEAPKVLPSPLFKENIKCFYYALPVKGKPQSAHFEEVTRETIEKFDMIPKRLTVFLLHGFTDGQDSVYIKSISDAYIRMCHNCNVMTIKWKLGVAYDEVAKKVPEISIAFAAGLNTIVKYGFMKEPFTFIGIGLGAHLAGIATQSLQAKVVHVVGLNPAGHGFRQASEKHRISKLSGKMVEIVHTDVRSGLSNESIGHLDFYVNGGFAQPSCYKSKDEHCSHLKSAEYYVEALTKPGTFLGIHCNGWKHFMGNSCNNEVVEMGSIYSGGFNFTNGFYYLKTQHHPPYGLGHVGTKFGKMEENSDLVGKVWDFVKDFFG